MLKTFQTIQFSIEKLFHFKQPNLTQIHSLKVKTVLFQAIQFIMSTQFSFIWHIDMTLSGATTPVQSSPRSDGNEEVLCIPQSFGITGTSPSDCLVS